MGKKKKKTSKHKIRFFFAFVLFSVITVVLGYNLFSNVISIRNMKKNKAELNSKIVDLEDEKKELENSILKLEDPEYIGKYVREKYFYSKEGELILRIED